MAQLLEQKEEKAEAEGNDADTTNETGAEFSSQELNEIEAAYKLSATEAILNQIPKYKSLKWNAILYEGKDNAYLSRIGIENIF